MWHSQITNTLNNQTAACLSLDSPVPKDFNLDVLFVMDSSQNIGRTNFQAEREFVKSLVRSFDISPTRSRAGAVTFGDHPILSIRFDDYSNVRSFAKGVDAVPYLGGRKRIDKALVYAARILSKARANSHKVAVIVTDGKQSLEPGDDSLEESARALRSVGVKVYVVGAGANADIRKLSQISEKPDDLFFARTFGGLVREIPPVIRHIVSGE